MENFNTKTKMTISYATRGVLGTFINSALLTFIL